VRIALQNSSNEYERRLALREVLFNELIPNPHFKDRLKDYFNGLFGMDIRHGRVLPICSDAEANDCLADEVSLDFRDEMAMTIAKIIASSGMESIDIRDVLTSQKSAVTPRMAQVLKSNAALRNRLGFENMAETALEEIEARNEQNWYWINRDPEGRGLATGTAGHYEHHAGVLTTPSFLLRSTMHISRANYFYSWFLCREADQTEAAASHEIKLAKRKPCSGCHAILEPLGSFWVHWRSNINPSDLNADWILDGIARESAEGEPLGSHGRIPLDGEQEIHSRTLDGSFRGNTGRGVQQLAAIGVKDPDFPRCMSQHAWQFVFGRPLDSIESGWSRLLGERLERDYNWDLREVLVDIVLSPGYWGERQ